MPVRLLDINVLLPLLWGTHPRHSDIATWFTTHRAEGWASCPITQLGFIRISCMPNVLPSPVAPLAAAAVLRKWTQAPDHQFWPNDLSAADAVLNNTPTLIGHKQLTDAYLIATARDRNGVLVSFDRALHGRIGVEAPN